MAVEALDGCTQGKGKVLRITEEVKLQIGILHSEFIDSTSSTRPTTLLFSDYPGCTHIIHASLGEKDKFFSGMLHAKIIVSQRFPKLPVMQLPQLFRAQTT